MRSLPQRPFPPQLLPLRSSMVARLKPAHRPSLWTWQGCSTLRPPPFLSVHSAASSTKQQLFLTTLRIRSAKQVVARQALSPRNTHAPKGGSRAFPPSAGGAVNAENTQAQNAWFLIAALSFRAALKGNNARLLKGNRMLNPITGQPIRHNPANHLTVEQLLERDGRSLQELIRDVLFGDRHAHTL